jgi:hypothetical protein
LTLTDNQSRYLLGTQIVPETIRGAGQVFTPAFRSYRLRAAIRCDNGSPPLGSRGAGGLTRLSAWRLLLGIEPRLLHPASPKENGRPSGCIAPDWDRVDAGRVEIARRAVSRETMQRAVRSMPVAPSPDSEICSFTGS